MTEKKKKPKHWSVGSWKGLNIANYGLVVIFFLGLVSQEIELQTDNSMGNRDLVRTKKLTYRTWRQNRSGNELPVLFWDYFCLGNQHFFSKIKSLAPRPRL